MLLQVWFRKRRPDQGKIQVNGWVDGSFIEKDGSDRLERQNAMKSMSLLSCVSLPLCCEPATLFYFRIDAFLDSVGPRADALLLLIIGILLLGASFVLRFVFNAFKGTEKERTPFQTQYAAPDSTNRGTTDAA